MTTIEETPSAIPAPDVRGTVVRTFTKRGRGYWLLFAFLTAVVLLGLYAWIVQLRDGLGVAGYNDNAFWGIYESDVVTFIGVSYGGAVISAILRLTGAEWRAPLTRLAEGTAVVTVLIGGALIIPHLGNPKLLWELVTRPNLSSPIFWDFVAVSTYIAGSVVFFALPLVPDMAIVHAENAQRLGRRKRLYAAISRGWAGTPKQRRVLHGALGLISIMIIPLAVSVHSVLSWAFALVSRPWWHESIWAPYFVVAALYSGVALVILVVAGFRRAYHLEAFITERHFTRLGLILSAFAAAYLYLTFADILPGAYTGEEGVAAVFRELLTGHFAIWFWLFVIGGGLIPLLLVALPWTRNVTGMVVAAAFVVPAMWLKRMLMVNDPATYNRITGTFGTYHFTWVPIAITVASLAAIPLLLMVLFRIVPLLSIDEIEEAGGTHTGELGQAPADDAETAAEHGRSAEPAKVEEAAGEARTAVRRRRFRLFRSTGAVLLLLAGAGILTAHNATPANAATRPAATITITGKETGSTVQLAATLTRADHKPMADATVQFLLLTTEFGPKGHLVPLGSATTDDNGTAQLTYHPTVSGSQKFTAAYTGGPTTATADTTVTVNSAQSAYRPAPPKPLAGVGKFTVGVLLAIVAIIWLTLAAQIARVRRVCRAAE